jgi:hypothetical protein
LTLVALCLGTMRVTRRIGIAARSHGLWLLLCYVNTMIARIDRCG